MLPENKMLFCGTTDKCRLNAARDISVSGVPSMRTHPCVGSKSPMIRFITVLLPEPDEPTNAIHSPAFTCKSRFFIE